MKNMYRSLRVRIQEGQEQGFTLIELLIVIVILGVLAGIVVFAVAGINDDSNKSACKSDKKNVEIASEAFYAQSSPKAYATGIGATGSTDPKTLVGSKLLREAPSNSGYTITYNATDGSVSATGC